MIVTNFINLMVEFLSANAMLVALLMAVVQYVKEQFQKFKWYRGWQMTIAAFLLSCLFALPEGEIVILPYAAGVVGLFLVATGLYDIIRSVVSGK